MKTLRVLLVEDDMIEVMKMKRAILSLELKHHIIETNNGEEALYALKSKTNLPDLILLDLNMPKMNGLEFLKELKKDSFLRHIPAVILTTSSNQKDLKECFEIGVSGYVLKPLKYEEYVEKINRLFNYWSMNELID